MSIYEGKICPYCNTPISGLEAVKVCPACGIVHHQHCWSENHGCSTFGCSAQNSEPQSVGAAGICVKCGTPVAAGQAFCPRCGAPQSAPAKKLCNKCGNELQDGQTFCPRCGQSVAVGTAPQFGAAIDQYNADVQTRKSGSKVKYIIIAAILAVVALVGVFVFNAISAKQAEEARDRYLEDAEEFLSFSLTAGANLEDIADTVQTYWYENIWDDKHGDDINDAIYYAMMDKAGELSDAEDYDSTMRSLYNKIKKVPDNVPEEDRDDLEDICDAVKDLFSAYEAYYEFATDPSGSYNTYSEANGDLTDEYLRYYRELKDLLE